MTQPRTIFLGWPPHLMATGVFSFADKTGFVWSVENLVGVSVLKIAVPESRVSEFIAYGFQPAIPLPGNGPVIASGFNPYPSS